MHSPTQPIIQIQNVSKSFGKVMAVDQVSLDIQAGEFFVLLGPSGCGKTTLLRMIAGFESPSIGRILIDGQDVTHVPPNQRPVNMVFQSYAVFPHMNVAENVAYGLKIAGVSKGGSGFVRGRAFHLSTIARAFSNIEARSITGPTKTSNISPSVSSFVSIAAA